MTLIAKLLIILLSLITFFTFLYLIRTRKMKKEYSLLWFFAGFAFVLLTVFTDIADKLIFMIGISYPPTLYLLITIIFLFLNLIFLSIELTKISQQNKQLIQEHALLKHTVEHLQKNILSSEKGYHKKQQLTNPNALTLSSER